MSILIFSHYYREGGREEGLGTFGMTAILVWDLIINFYAVLDSAWPVYIAPEELGNQCNIAGLRILALQGKGAGVNMHGSLEIYSPADYQTPALSCKHNAIRCTGRMGNYLYVEVGTRCTGGPGILWMYFGSTHKANLMKDVFYTYVSK